MAVYKKERSTSTKGHYVTNAEILEAFHEAKALGQLTNRLGRCLMLIANRYSNHPWFNGFSYKDDMIAHALVNLSKNWYKFNPEKSDNPFAYYTTAVYRSFQNYIEHERLEARIKDKMLIELGANPSFNFEEDAD